MAEEAVIRERFAPIFQKLGALVGAARDAFNRHSAASLEELKKLHGELAADLKNSLDAVDQILAKAPDIQRASLVRWQSILIHLQVLTETLAGLAAPIGRKAKEGILFSDKAVAQANHLFDQAAGILRSLLDTIKTDNDFLKRYVIEESQKLVHNCNEFATEHEARLIEGLCLPQAAPLFLALLDGMRTLGQYGVNIGRILAQ
uniref:PhoU domain-containing protein n=1 Tax=Desulfobacca acetoxidans TaxID=60893 RepID=A0A7V4G6C6_9BACT